MSCCGQEAAKPSLSADQLMLEKEIVRWCAWFVSLDEPLRILHFCSELNAIDDLPEDGFLTARTSFADGTGENIGGNGWIIVQETTAGLLLQATGENVKPDPVRYPNAKFIKDKLAPSALLHVAMEAARSWR